jgi:hypothetical protein
MILIKTSPFVVLIRITIGLKTEKNLVIHQEMGHDNNQRWLE